MPKIEVPKFRLSRVFADGTREDLQVCPITGLGTDVIMGRRDLLGMGITVSTLLVGLSACGGKKEKAAPPPPPPPATPGPLRAHKTAVSGLTLSSKDDLLVSSGIDDAVKVWTFPSGELRPSTNMPSANKGFHALLLSPDGQKLATEIDDLSPDIKIESFPSGGTISTLTGHKEPVLSLSFSSDSRTLASGSQDKTVRLWQDGRPTATFEGHTDAVTSVHISPDNQNLYSSSLDGSVRVWSVPQRKFVKSVASASSPIHDSSLSPDGTLLATAHHDGSARVWSVPDGALRRTGKYHTEPVRSIQLSRDGAVVATGSDDGTVKRWPVKDGPVIDTIAERIGNITKLLLSRNGLRLIIGTALGIVMVWDVVARRVITFLFDPSIARSNIRGTTFSLFDNTLGRTVSYTLPCGSPIPAGATCTCNCVPGKLPAETVYTPPSCSCNQVCRCLSVCSCVGNCTCAPQTQCTCNRVCTCVPQCVCLAVPR